MNRIRANNDIKLQQSIYKILAAFVLLVPLARCLKFSNKYTFILACGVSVVEIVLNKKIRIIPQDILSILILLIVFLNRYPDYYYFNCIYFLIAWLGFYLFRQNIEYIKSGLIISICFVILNWIASLINIIAPSIYFSAISKVLNTTAYENARYYFFNFNQITGLSDHYSRNAYYCVLGISVAFAALLVKQIKYRKIIILFLIAQMIMLLRIGKRGHLLFLIFAMLVTYLITAPKLSRKIMRLLKFLAVVIIGFAVIIEFFPSTGNVFSRFLETNGTNDISTGRFYLWGLAYSYFLKKPIFGNGYGFFNTTVWNDTVKTFYAGVHNDYLQWLCEEGIIGFCIHVIFTISMLAITIRVTKRYSKEDNADNNIPRVLIIWSLLFQIFVLSYSFTGLPHYDYEINSVYFLSLAVPVALLDDRHNKSYGKFIRWVKH